MSEASLWSRAREELSPFGKLERIENGIAKGTPDVAWLLRRYPRVDPVSGWLELKYEPAWPSSDARPVIIKKLRREQVDFAEGWSGAGGRSFFLLQVGRDYVLFGEPVARLIFDRAATRPLILGMATASAEGRGFPTADIVKGLTA